jgi:hypothetical protein
MYFVPEGQKPFPVSSSRKPKNPRALQCLSTDVSLADDRRHDQSNGVNSVSATAGCSLFWTTVQTSVPTDARVIRSIFSPQSQMPIEDAFFMMTPFITRALYARGALFQQSAGQRFNPTALRDRFEAQKLKKIGPVGTDADGSALWSSFLSRTSQTLNHEKGDLTHPVDRTVGEQFIQDRTTRSAAPAR